MLIAKAAALCALFTGGDDHRIETEPIVIECRADAELRGVDIRLRDLATVKTADAELAARLLEIDFGRRPAFGFTRVLSRQDVMLRVVAEGIPAGRLKMAGASRVVLSPRSASITPKDLIELASRSIDATLALEEANDVSYDPTGKLRTLRVPPGRRMFDMRAKLPKGRTGFSQTLVEIEIVVDDKIWQTVRIPFRMNRFQRVVVARSPVKRGEPLGEHNLKLERLPAAQGTSPFLSSLESVRGKVAARALQTGHRLTLGSVGAPAVVYKSDAVDIVSKRGRVLITARGLALQDGAVGARIMVQSLASGRPIPAIVRGAGVVVVTNFRRGRR